MLTRKDYQAIVIGGLIGALSCGIICGVGCDWVVPGECKSEGHLFGPCQAGAVSPEGCAEGLTCLEVTAGWMCVEVNGEVSAEEQECSAFLGEVGCSPLLGLCVITCKADADCHGGTTCDERHGMCVYPKEPTEPAETTSTSSGGEGMTTGASTTTGETTGWTTGSGDAPGPGESLGPCLGWDMLCYGELDRCVLSETLNANICAPPKGEGLVTCEGDAGCLVGQVCDPTTHWCLWSF